MKCAYCTQYYMTRCWICFRPICEEHSTDAGIGITPDGGIVPEHQCAPGLECEKEESDAE